jgi:hypothetical protein
VTQKQAFHFRTGLRTVSTVGGFEWFIANRATSVRCRNHNAALLVTCSSVCPEPDSASQY